MDDERDDLEPLLTFWRAQDDLFERVEPAWWGATVTDARYPAIQEPNYARVEARRPVELGEIESALLPAVARSGSVRSHVVIFHPDDQTDLVVEASTRGERVTWDLVMVASGSAGRSSELDDVEEIVDFDEAFWAAHRDSARLFDVSDDVTVDQLQAVEREVLIPAGRRWFAVRDDGGFVAFAALLVLEGVGYLDHVVTFPEARRRGYAEALTQRVVAEAAAMGARRTYLLAEPEGPAVRIYDRIGFERAGHFASWLSPAER